MPGQKGGVPVYFFMVDINFANINSKDKDQFVLEYTYI